MSKTRRMTEFLIPQQSQPHALSSVSESEGQEVAISVGERNTSDEEDETVVISNQSISQDEWITDVALWPDKPSRELIDKWALEGSVELQNVNDDLFRQKSVRVQAANEPSGRFCTSQMFFFRRNKNGVTVNRSWLCFSPSEGKVCVLCVQAYVRSVFTAYSQWL